MKKNLQYILPPLISLAIVLITSAAIIAYGRGYRPTSKEDQFVRPTGLLSANSDPTGAEVSIDGVLKAATKTSLNVDPGKRKVTIAKEGFLPWEKNLNIEKEIVTTADAFLFPVSPSLSALTSRGVLKPILSPDSSKIAYISPPKEGTDGDASNGVWIFDLMDRPLTLNRDPRQVATWKSLYPFDKAEMRWSPDSSEILFQTASESRLYTVGRTDEYKVVTTTLPQLLADWQKEEQTKQTQQLSSFKQGIVDIATSSAKILAISPDETKILYEATASATIPSIIIPPVVGANSTQEERTLTPGNIYVYDSKEDKNFFLMHATEILPTPSITPTKAKTQTKQLTTNNPQLTTISPYPLKWFPTSRHLLVVYPNKIDVLEYDRTNWITIYAGPFMDNFVAPWPGGSRLVIVTNLNPGASPLPNLYTVNLR